MNIWSEYLGVTRPQCNRCAQCCKCASVSMTKLELERKSAAKDAFAADFLSVFEPYENIEQAALEFPVTVERSIAACEKNSSKLRPEEITFYKCKYSSENNDCLVYEDRPEFCRNYPENPFLVFHKSCAFEEWADACRKRYEIFEIRHDELKERVNEIEFLKYRQKVIRTLAFLELRNDPGYRFMILFPSYSLISPKFSWLSCK